MKEKSRGRSARGNANGDVKCELDKGGAKVDSSNANWRRQCESRKWKRELLALTVRICSFHYRLGQFDLPLSHFDLRSPAFCFRTPTCGEVFSQRHDHILSGAPKFCNL